MKYHRMRPVTALLLIVVGLFAVPASAQIQTEISFSPFIQRTSGESSYLLDLIAQDGEGGPLIRLRSELVFPQNQTLAGGQFRIFKTEGRIVRRSLVARYAANLGNPGDRMTDSDWWDDVRFSYTESKLTNKVTQFSVEGTELLVHGTTWGISAHLGYSVMAFNNSMTGYNGYVLQFDTATNSFGTLISVSGTTLALLYEITYKMPQIGIATQWVPSQRADVAGLLAFVPVHVSDRDLHLLRGFSTEASGFGKGILARLVGRLRLNNRESGWQPYAELRGELFSIKADVSSDQMYYTDSPDGPEDETGIGFNALPHEISGNQFSIGLSIGLWR